MYRVLIADDERIERMILYQVLERNLRDRCEIVQAENGREALEVYAREKVQIAILDIEMPGIDGIEAARRIRQADPWCSIIFLTAFDEFAYARQAITVRALDYLLKPCDEKELMLVLEEAIRLAEEHDRQARQSAEGDRQARQSAGGDRQARQSVEGDRQARQSAEGDRQVRQPADGDRQVRQAEGSGRQDGLSVGWEGQACLSGRAERRNGQAEGGLGQAGAPGEPRPWGTGAEESGGLTGKVAELAYRYIRENYRRDISMQDLAGAMNYSEAYFCKLFKQCFNKNFTAYLTEYRVKEAKRLLEQPTINVKEVGKAVGYMDPNYFARVFKRITGQTPTEYRSAIFTK